MPDDDEWLRKALDNPERDTERLRRGENIVLYPLSGWSVGTLPENAVMVVLEFLTPPPTIATRVLRLGMMRPQCAELAQVLERLARTPHVLPPEKPS
jgi:hypothetical protein